VYDWSPGPGVMAWSLPKALTVDPQECRNRLVGRTEKDQDYWLALRQIVKFGKAAVVENQCKKR
jgi:hypothetical protein